MPESRREVLTIRADYALLSELRDFVRHAGTKVGLSEAERDKLVLAIDEAATNIITHAAKSHPEAIDCRCTMDDLDQSIICELVYDTHDHFDPVAAPKHEEIQKRVQEFKRGGYGLFLMHTLVDSIEYRREGNRSVIRLVKRHQA
jgi:anti-sigma regulatory factor (Ser/Thr protein kinase)